LRPLGVQVNDRLGDGREGERFRGREGGGPATLLDQLPDLVAEFGFDGAELVLDVDAVLAANGEQVFALHVQLARQREDTNLVFLQAQLPVVDQSYGTAPRGPGRPSHPLFYRPRPS